MVALSRFAPSLAIVRSYSPETIESAEATRRITRGFLAALAGLVAVLWPLDLVLLEAGSPERTAATFARVGILVVLATSYVALRRARGVAAIYGAWSGAFLGLTAVCAAVVGGFLGMHSPLVNAAVLVPFGTIVLVAGLGLRALLAFASGAVAIATLLLTSPEGWPGYDHGWALVVFTVASGAMALAMGHLLTEAVREQTRANARIAALVEQQHDLMRDVTREMRAPLERAWRLLADQARGEGSLADATEQLDDLLTQLEGWAGDLLAYVRNDAEGNTPTDHVNVGEALRGRVADWNALRPPIVVTGVDQMNARVRASRSAFERAIEPLVRHALQRAERSVALRLGGAPPGHVAIEVSHDGQEMPSVSNDLALALSRRIAERAGGSCDLVHTADSDARSSIVRVIWPAAGDPARPSRGARSTAGSLLAWLRNWWRTRPVSSSSDFAARERMLTAWVGRRLALSAIAASLILWPTDRLLVRFDSHAESALQLWRAEVVILLAVFAVALSIGLRRRWNPNPLWFAAFAWLSISTFVRIGTSFSPTSPAHSALWLVAFSGYFPAVSLAGRIAGSVAALGLGVASLIAADPAAWAARTDKGAFLLILWLACSEAIWFGHLVRGLLRSNHERAREIERLLAAQRELLQAVSHEIRTPLARARFRLAALEHAMSDGARQERVAGLGSQLDQLDDLIEEMGSYADRRADGRSETAVETTSFDLPGELRRCADEWRSSRAEIAITGLDDVAPVHLDASSREFARVVGNLVSNAVRHARSEVRLRGVDEQNGTVRVEVLDDGPGIPPEDRDRVFQPFTRLDASRSRVTGGVGLGLAIARRIVERHGGTIHVTESPSGGARFVVLWPAARPRAV